MPLNNYLVIGVNPANNETTVPLDKTITVTFSQHMDETTLTSSTLVLKKVNGELISCTLDYSGSTMTATIDPDTNLAAGTQYQLQIVGTADGVRSITGDYMGVSRSYEFTTSHTAALSEPTNLSSTVDNGYPTLTWQRPADYDTAVSLTYEVIVSESNIQPPDEPPMPYTWPSTGDINQTNGTVLNVPKKFSDGTYYAYVRALNGTEVSEWSIPAQFTVETAVASPTPSTGDIFSFDVADTYPKADSVDVTPEQIIIVFSDDVDMTTVEGNIYIVKKEGKKSLTLVDYMTEYSLSKSIEAVIEPPITDPPTTTNVITLSAVLEDDAEYTVVVREELKNTAGGTLGIAHSWSFMTKFSRLYGDAEMIRADVGNFISNISNKMLYKAMQTNSIHAYNIASQTSSFDDALYQNGAAPYYVHQYVRHKTAYELLLSGYMQSSSSAGSAVTLGDLTVDKKSSQGGSMASLMNEVKKNIKPWEDAIHGQNNRGYAKPIVVVKGENVESYPDFMTRTEFRELGQ